MKLAIMQPYFMPYIGYFQLIANVDMFIIYDQIKYTKKGWINRNRILRNGSYALISLPLNADSDTLNIVDRRLADDFKSQKINAQIENAYRSAPYFRETKQLIEEILSFEDHNLFRFNLNSIQKTCARLGINTPIRISSHFEIDERLKGQDKVISLCKSAGADVYINPIGGLELYDKASFAEHGIDLRFLHPLHFEYLQFGEPFVPWLSIIDVLMFNSAEVITEQLCSSWRFE